VRRAIVRPPPAEFGVVRGEVLIEIGPILDFLAQSGVWLAVAFVLGLVHAFDADHVMALSVLATGERGAAKGAQAGLRWSAGHGLVLLVAGLGLFGLGRALPTELTLIAERGVGFVMVGLGLSVWIQLVRRSQRRPFHVHFHAHDGIKPHAHWHDHAASEVHPEAHRHYHEHAASMVGALHGFAGSAPILALLPAAARSPMLGLAYLVVFGLGVALAMVLVSGAFGHLAGRLSGRRQSAAMATLRALSATGSIAIGVWLSWSA
jgi:nickel/cobalt transporter (NicO) family protein